MLEFQVASKPADLTVNDVQQVYNTNVFGIVRMMHTFIPPLKSQNNLS